MNRAERRRQRVYSVRGTVDYVEGDHVEGATAVTIDWAVEVVAGSDMQAAVDGANAFAREMAAIEPGRQYIKGSVSNVVVKRGGKP